jgi:HD-like signal output (HDOD) protein
MTAAASGKAAQADTTTTTGGAAFNFVQTLARELSTGRQELPGYPAVVARVQQILNNEYVDLSRVVQAIGSEPIVAGQILRMANSAALNPSHVPVADLRTAVTRVGLDAVRTATISFAMRQVRANSENGIQELRLESLWRRSVKLASLCQAVARRLTQLNSEAAMLAGLLQGVGRLYILARASKHRALFCDEEAYNEIEQTWHVSIATALLESWGIAPEIVQAVRDSEDLQQDTRGSATLSDVVAVGALLTDFEGSQDDLRAQISAARPCQRLHLGYESCEKFLSEAAEEIAALREALSN